MFLQEAKLDFLYTLKNYDCCEDHEDLAYIEYTINSIKESNAIELTSIVYDMLNDNDILCFLEQEDVEILTKKLWAIVKACI